MDQQRSRPDVEAERRQRLEELAADEGTCGPEQYRPGSFGCHELLDRTSLVAALVEQYVLSHAACVMNPEWYALAEQAVSALNELYQRVGAEHLDAPPTQPGVARSPRD